MTFFRHITRQTNESVQVLDYVQLVDGQIFRFDIVLLGTVIFVTVYPANPVTRSKSHFHPPLPTLFFFLNKKVIILSRRCTYTTLIKFQDLIRCQLLYNTRKVTFCQISTEKAQRSLCEYGLLMFLNVFYSSWWFYNSQQRLRPACVNMGYWCSSMYSTLAGDSVNRSQRLRRTCVNMGYWCSSMYSTVPSDSVNRQQRLRPACVNMGYWCSSMYSTVAGDSVNRQQRLRPACVNMGYWCSSMYSTVPSDSVNRQQRLKPACVNMGYWCSSMYSAVTGDSVNRPQRLRRTCVNMGYWCSSMYSTVPVVL